MSWRRHWPKCSPRWSSPRLRPRGARAAAGQTQPAHPAGRRPGVRRAASAVARRLDSGADAATPGEDRPHGGGDIPEVAGPGGGEGGAATRDASGAWEVVTNRQPTDEEWRDLEFAWRIVTAVSSNAIVVARDRCAVGIGAGQQNRRDAGRIAAAKAGDRGRGGAYASDAFFPFADGLDGAVEAGCTAVVQPGGSVRDAEVIEAADRHGLAMAFTGQRTFRH